MQWLDNFIDLTARRPGGKLGRLLYRNSRGHRKGFELLKQAIDIGPDEHLLEVGCGGGVLLGELMTTAASGAAIDHSKDMVALALERNAEAIAAGRLEIRLGDVYSLPWPDNSFDAVASSHMFFFIDRPLEMLRAVLRTLRPGGRLVIVTNTQSRLGRALLWPCASAMYCYSDQELAGLLHEAGFDRVEVKSVWVLQQLACAYKPADRAS